MNDIEIVSTNTGKPAPLKYQNKKIQSGINKQPVIEALFLSWTNLDGDGQADLVHHGGKDKAVCVYPYEHYSYWEKELQRTLIFGAFGENLTTLGGIETDVCIGDIYRLGEAIVQVSQPRQPCYKLAARYGLPKLPLIVQETGFTGYYLRVLQQGFVSPHHRLSLMTRHPKGVTIAFANRMMHDDKDDMVGVRRMLEVEELSDSWKATFTKRLHGEKVNIQERLTGNDNSL